jgi:hypothetical protein
VDAFTEQSEASTRSSVDIVRVYMVLELKETRDVAMVSERRGNTVAWSAWFVASRVVECVDE